MAVPRSADLSSEFVRLNADKWASWFDHVACVQEWSCRVAKYGVCHVILVSVSLMLGYVCYKLLISLLLYFVSFKSIAVWSETSVTINVIQGHEICCFLLLQMQSQLRDLEALCAGDGRTGWTGRTNRGTEVSRNKPLMFFCINV
jgi:hypothetical protein